MKNPTSSGFAYALLAAFLFGASMPASKFLLHDLDSWLLAGMLYFGSGLGLLILYIGRSFFEGSFSERSLRRGDGPWLFLSILFGGLAAPVLLMQGLARTHASSASLFLNTESVFTALIAWSLFREIFNRRMLVGLLLIFFGGVVLSLNGEGGGNGIGIWKGAFFIQNLSGPLFVMGACLSWAIDNNVTRKISERDPLQIVIVKSLVAGAVNMLLAFWLGSSLPSFAMSVKAGCVGFVCYGISLYCFILALRYIGSARASAFFSLGPFVGTGFSILFLSESPSLQMIAAAVLMAGGVLLLWQEETSEDLHSSGVTEVRQV